MLGGQRGPFLVLIILIPGSAKFRSWLVVAFEVPAERFACRANRSALNVMLWRFPQPSWVSFPFSYIRGVDCTTDCPTLRLRDSEIQFQ